MRVLQLLRGVAVIVPLGLLIGCGDAGNQRQGVNDPRAQMHPELLEVSASPASPGETIEIRFPQETGRGIAWVLEEQDGNDWRVLYYLTAAIDNNHNFGSPSWWSVDDSEGRSWEDIGVSGPGPDTIQIPDSIDPGTYRLCTANSVENICTMLDINKQG
ncbi:hypothetical protein [Arthrobacter subterraneus]|uniref:hypothetical protein n=1 Tax=Arthrobacter subterraneus TaxID=335973 RepID=UPI00382A46FF